MNKDKGFTVVEIIIVIVVLAILVTVGGLAWRNVRDNAIESSRRSDISRYKNAIEKYYQDNLGYPYPTDSNSCRAIEPNLSECQHNEQNKLLAPKYIDNVPAQKGDDDLYYRVEQQEESKSEDRYGIRVKLPDNSFCKTGKNMTNSWWDNIPNCNF